MSGKKIAVFGGTFNPIHTGHLSLCDACCKALGVDEAMLIPANVPPHKAAKQLASNEDRYAMCLLAAKDRDYLTVNDMELNAGGKSYTVLTMQKLKADHPDDTFYFVMGTDMFLCFDRWVRWQEILSYCDIAVSKRNPEDDALIAAKKEQMLNDYPELRRDCIHTVTADCTPISSTELRSMLQNGDDAAKAYLPDGVFDYIMAHGLYKDGEMQ